MTHVHCYGLEHPAKNKTLKTTLILLPGLNGTTGFFNPLLECVQGHFEVLAISYPVNEEKSYPELTSYVLDKIKTVKGNYIILGESFSGPISLFVSGNKPEGLIGVALVATFITAPNFKVGKLLPWRLGFSLTRPLYRIRLALSKDKNQSLISNISTEMQKVSPRVLSARIRQIFMVNATESQRNCAVPVIYFRGTRDYVVPRKNLVEIMSVKSDIKVVEFNAQHFLLQSEPVQAFTKIKKFAEDCL